MTEAAIQSAIRLALGQRDDVMLFRINVGKFRPLHGDQNRVIQSAPNGTPDLLGVVEVSPPASLMDEVCAQLQPDTLAELLAWLHENRGRAMTVEVKSEIGKQQPDQKSFQGAWEKRGGLYIIARSLDDVLSALP